MNKIVNKCLLKRNKFMPKIHLKQSSSLNKSGFRYSTCGKFTENKDCEPFTKPKKEFKNLKKHEIQDIFMKTSYTNLVFSMIWFIEI